MDNHNTNSEQASQYSIGIDLGTTHCALSYLDTSDKNADVEIISIDQLTASGTVENKNQLGSFPK